MLAQKLDPVESYCLGVNGGARSPFYQRKLRARGISIHARFVARALDVFAGSSVMESQSSAPTSLWLSSKREGYDVKA